MAACDEGSSPPWIAQFFHSLPHVNFDFKNTSSVFDPQDSNYQQALFLYGLIPCLFGCLAVIILCGQFVASCCSSHCPCDKRAHRCNGRCGLASGWILCLSVLICSACVIAAFVFNDNVDQGIQQVSQSVGNVNETLLQVQTKVVDIKSNLLDMEDTITDLQELPDVPSQIEDKLSSLKTEVRRIIATLTQVKKVSLPNIDSYVKVTEYYRWWGTFATLALNTLTCILVFYASLRKSICGFVLVIMLGICCLLLNWASCGIEVAATIGMSDLCIDPKSAILIYTPTPPLNEIVKYYVNCPTDTTNPYQKYVTNAKQNLDAALNLVAWLKDQPWAPDDKLKDVSDGLKVVSTDLQVINNDLNCSSTREDYHTAQCALCTTVVPGLAQLLLVTLILGFFLIFLLVAVTPILHSMPLDKRRRRKWNILMCSLDSAGEVTPYQSFSDGSSEAVPLLDSTPPRPTYDGVHQSVEYQFHSCEDGPHRRRQYPGYIPNQLHNQATQNPQAQPVITRPQSNNQINSMAF